MTMHTARIIGTRKQHLGKECGEDQWHRMMWASDLEEGAETEGAMMGAESQQINITHPQMWTWREREKEQGHGMCNPRQNMTQEVKNKRTAYMISCKASNGAGPHSAEGQSDKSSECNKEDDVNEKQAWHRAQAFSAEGEADPKGTQLQRRSNGGILYPQMKTWRGRENRQNWVATHR
jgi:hypothetical protein